MIKSIFDTVPRLRADSGAVGGINTQIALTFALLLFAACRRLIVQLFSHWLFIYRSLTSRHFEALGGSRGQRPLKATVKRRQQETKEEFWRRPRLLPALPLCICLRIMMTQAAVNSDGSIR